MKAKKIKQDNTPEHKLDFKLKKMLYENWKWKAKKLKTSQHAEAWKVLKQNRNLVHRTQYCSIKYKSFQMRFLYKLTF